MDSAVDPTEIIASITKDMCPWEIITVNPQELKSYNSKSDKMEVIPPYDLPKLKVAIQALDILRNDLQRKAEQWVSSQGNAAEPSWTPDQKQQLNGQLLPYIKQYLLQYSAACRSDDKIIQMIKANTLDNLNENLKTYQSIRVDHIQNRESTGYTRAVQQSEVLKKAGSQTENPADLVNRYFFSLDTLMEAAAVAQVRLNLEMGEIARKTKGKVTLGKLKGIYRVIEKTLSKCGPHCICPEKPWPLDKATDCARAMIQYDDMSSTFVGNAVNHI
jgi:hypothetical protein